MTDTSYSAATAASRQYRNLQGGVAMEIQASNEAELERQRSLLRHHLTKIRLLAPAGALERAQALRQSHSELERAISPELGEALFRQLRQDVAGAREDLIASAKKAMSLPR